MKANISRLFLLFSLIFILLLSYGCTRSTNKDGEVNYDDILSDAWARYPDADKILIEGKGNIGEDEILSIAIIYDYDSICPVRKRVRYKLNYGFETGIQETLVKDCKYECVGSCMITTREEAIVASHSLPGSEAVRQILNRWSQDEIKADANYDKQRGIWEVTFSHANNTLNVNLTAKNPEIISIKKY